MKESLILVHSVPLETQVALIEQGRLSELFIETEDERPLVGNIIKGRVSRVLPGMQAAFVEVGLEKAGFLYVGDIVDRELEEVETEDDTPPEPSRQRIQDLVREGQEIYVQVTKAPIGTKGARLTNYLTIAGRHLVLTPDQARIGVSRKIRFAKERARLRKILNKIQPESMGLIARTVAEHRSEEELTADRDYLLRVWQSVQRRAEKVQPPATVYNELTMPLRVLRDSFTDQFNKVIVDDATEHERVQQFLQTAIPRRSGDLELYRGKRPMTVVYGVESGLREALKPEVALPSGGSIVIEETEALTSIDVNTGRFVGRKNLEETVLKTKLEAVEEICRQIRLRNIGGILILDFIDMDLAENRTKVFQALKTALRRDRAKTSILKISDLGLVEMTRQRLHESLTRSIGERCPHCHGRGYMVDPRTLAASVYRELASAAHKGGPWVVRAHPWVTDYLLDEALPYIEALESAFNLRVRILPDTSLPEEQFAVAAETRPQARG